MLTRMQQRRGTSTQWVDANPILGAGEIGFELENNRFKIGNGTSTWNLLDYFSNESDVTTAINNAISNLVDGAPDLLNTLNEIAAAINDDPDFFTNIATSLDGKVDVTGDTMTGDLTLANDPTSNLHAATKQYVDQAEADANTYTDDLIGDATVDGTTGNTVKDRIDTAVSDLVDGAPALLDTLNELAAAIGDDEDFVTTITTSIGEKVAKSGDTMTGDLTLPNDPTSDLHAATKQYVDNLETMEAGGTTGQVLSKASDTDYDVAWTDISTELSSLDDVDVTGLADGNALIYDSGTLTWIPGDAGGNFEVSETAPATPGNGDTWFDSATGKAYIYYTDGDSSQWVEIGNPGGYASLSVLSDVDLTGLADGNSLVYDSATSSWLPGEGGGTAPDIDDLNDVEIAAVADGDFLRYNSSTSKWENDDYTDVIKLNGQTISANYTVPVGYNGLSAGPITIADGVTVTVSDGSAWSIV